MHSGVVVTTTLDTPLWESGNIYIYIFKALSWVKGREERQRVHVQMYIQEGQIFKGTVANCRYLLHTC